MIVLFLFLVPLIGGLVAFLLKGDAAVRGWSLLVSLVVLALALMANFGKMDAASQQFSAAWLGSLGSSFSLKLDGMSRILCLLTAVSYPLILIATWKTAYRKPHNFFGLMLLTQAG